MPVVGFLTPASPDGYQRMVAAFRQGLQESGYVEGRNVTIEYRASLILGNKESALCCMVREWLSLKRGVRVVTASGDGPDRHQRPFACDDAADTGSFAQYEKTRLVAKLRGARERIRQAEGKCEGRKSYAERAPELVMAAERLHRRSPKGHHRSLREIGNALVRYSVPRPWKARAPS
jgi:hypothetical protein